MKFNVHEIQSCFTGKQCSFEKREMQFIFEKPRRLFIEMEAVNNLLIPTEYGFEILSRKKIYIFQIVRLIIYLLHLLEGFNSSGNEVIRGGSRIKKGIGKSMEMWVRMRQSWTFLSFQLEAGTEIESGVAAAAQRWNATITLKSILGVTSYCSLALFCSLTARSLFPVLSLFYSFSTVIRFLYSLIRFKSFGTLPSLRCLTARTKI